MLQRRKRGFSNLEFLLVLGVLTICLAIIIPVFVSLFVTYRRHHASVVDAGLIALISVSVLSFIAFGLIPGLIALLWGLMDNLRNRRIRPFRALLEEYYGPSLLLLVAGFFGTAFLTGAYSLLFTLLQSLGVRPGLPL